MMNDAIYRTFLSIYNTTGEPDALEYLSQYFNPEGWQTTLAELTDHPSLQETRP